MQRQQHSFLTAGMSLHLHFFSHLIGPVLVAELQDINSSGGRKWNKSVLPSDYLFQYFFPGHVVKHNPYWLRIFIKIYLNKVLRWVRKDQKAILRNIRAD